MSRWMMIGALSAVVCVLALGASCERKGPEPAEPGEETGAGTTGAGTGQAIGGDTKSTLIGRGVGSRGGYVIGNEMAKEPGLPVLFDFETDEAVAAWQVEDEIKAQVVLSVSDKATTGKRSLKMVLKAGEWPGMYTLKVPADWSAYSELKFDVIAEQDADLAIRIDDVASTDYESRFNMGGLAVNKGNNTVTVDVVDVGDAIDLKKVKAIFIFSSGVTEDMTFHIDNIRLAK